jgi:hypothetical protein
MPGMKNLEIKFSQFGAQKAFVFKLFSEFYFGLSFIYTYF